MPESPTQTDSSPRPSAVPAADRTRGSDAAAGAALVLGTLALVGAFFRVVNLGSVLLGAVGVVLGVAGWRLADRRPAPDGGGMRTRWLASRGAALTGAALSAAAIVASIAVMVHAGSPLGGLTSRHGSAGTSSAARPGAGTGSGPGSDLGPADTSIPLPPLNEDPVTETQPGFVAQSYAGSGDQTVRLRSPLADVALAVISYRGAGSFTVDTTTRAGVEGESLVSTVGSWQGTKLVNAQNFTDRPVTGLQVHADSGEWTVALRPLGTARRWDGGQPVSGRGADVLLARAAFTGRASITAVHRGSSDFTVSAYGGGAAVAGSLVSGTGDVTGTATVPAGTVVLAVDGDGTWTITRR